MITSGSAAPRLNAASTAVALSRLVRRAARPIAAASGGPAHRRPTAPRSAPPPDRPLRPPGANPRAQAPTPMGSERALEQGADLLGVGDRRGTLPLGLALEGDQGRLHRHVEIAEGLLVGIEVDDEQDGFAERRVLGERVHDRLLGPTIRTPGRGDEHDDGLAGILSVFERLLVV